MFEQLESMDHNMTFTPSPAQAAFFSALTDPSGSNIALSACAGAGKSTAIEHGILCLPRKLPSGLAPSIFVTSFGKGIIESMKERMAKHGLPGLNIATLHSLGLNALKSFGIVPRNVKIDGRKVAKLVYNTGLGEGPDMPQLIKLVGLGKSEASLTPDWARLCQVHELDFDIGQAQATRIAQSVLNASLADRETLDFDDMLWMPVVLNVLFTKYDYVFVDEAQDVNPVQMEIIERLLKLTSKLVIVGDPRQAIYAFRGAGHGAMDEMIKRFNMQSMPLSVSYRCPRNIVLEARTRGGCTAIQPSANAVDGTVQRLDVYEPCIFNSSAVILCRNTAPLVAMCYALLQRNIPCRILGRDIGAQLAALVKKMRACDIPDLEDKIGKWQSREVAKCEIDGRSPDRVYDQHDCILHFTKMAQTAGGDTVERVLAMIDSLFNDQTKSAKLTLCTVHKAKGLEWKTVFILDFAKYMPSRYAKQEWQKVQEKNLIYVALTRCMDTLIYIESDKWKT
jgi:DNA helicase II / ATP-dependent DNA helicase PcrA